ncbi:exonuclease domain-containing protein [Amorphoplanes digitatis]|uniref:Inhibitor of KinA sporulation pathway (Predicted exonuclease) n=1 Tax=Actinoplanes digitatis TaxID=1868 RepID=A0A7W7HXM3_9ACTN|nr:3'-5' exonuclease [Actinoplanes digitatis]MBB4762659.1 inhibitor of KinA sporulation pathway (predicted exonuclease) [Actinoplanes digitatis]GID91842.1 hypothetical protein Adi01nite_12540 [Actinoplanes digitatis]
MHEAFERFLNVVDVEATCWADGPPRGESSEIIEIGICVVDTADWRRVEKRRILVRPRRSRVSEFCTELTGLTQADVDGAADFAAACAQVRDELRGRFRTWASWGEYDRRQFERQCVPATSSPSTATREHHCDRSPQRPACTPPFCTTTSAASNSSTGRFSTCRSTPGKS